MKADLPTRRARMRAHAAFDPLWQDLGFTRYQAYGWLSRRLGIPRDQTHMVLFDVDTCNRVVEEVNTYLRARIQALRLRQSVGSRPTQGEGTMSSYEEAPATRLLATHCAVCGRPLVDASSVELGIGPVCREGAEVVGISDEAHAEANRIVYKIACEQTGEAVAAGCLRLHALGYHVLAEKILERIGCVRITEEGGRLVVASPFSDAAVAAMRDVKGRRWDGDRKVNSFPLTKKSEVWNILRCHYAGLIGIGPKGPFKIAPSVPSHG